MLCCSLYDTSCAFFFCACEWVFIYKETARNALFVVRQHLEECVLGQRYEETAFFILRRLTGSTFFAFLCVIEAVVKPFRGREGEGEGGGCMPVWYGTTCGLPLKAYCCAVGMVVRPLIPFGRRDGTKKNERGQGRVPMLLPCRVALLHLEYHLLPREKVLPMKPR